MALAAKRVYLIRTDRMQEDVDGVGIALLGMGPGGTASVPLERKKEDYPRKADTRLANVVPDD